MEGGRKTRLKGTKKLVTETRRLSEVDPCLNTRLYSIQPVQAVGKGWGKGGGREGEERRREGEERGSRGKCVCVGCVWGVCVGVGV